jgi:chaperonin cofactor prefoldin
MMSLTSKDETIQRLSRTAEDKEKTLRAQLADLQGKSKHRLGDLGSQVEQLQAEVARRMLESERLAESLSAVTKANDENKVPVVADSHAFFMP